MECSYAIRLVRDDETMAEYLDLYDDIQSELSELDLDVLKPFVSNFDDAGEFIMALADLNSLLSETDLSQFYEDDSQDAQEMIEAAVRDFLISRNLVPMPPHMDMDWNQVDQEIDLAKEKYKGYCY